MRVNILAIFGLILLLSNLGFAQFTFGPGDLANDCSNDTLGTMVFGASGTYTWSGAAIMQYNNTAGPGTHGYNCIEVTASDVIIDCQGNVIDGLNDQGEVGIYIDQGVSNVTILDCIVNDFGWQSGARMAVGNVFINGSDDITIDNSQISYTGGSPAMGDSIAYNGLIFHDGLTVVDSVVAQTVAGAADASGIGGRSPSTGNALPAFVDDVTLDNSEFTGFDDSGATLDGDNLLVTNDCLFDSNTEEGLAFNGANDLIEDSEFTNNGNIGLSISNADNTRVFSNDIIGNTGHGLVMSFAEDSRIYDNLIAANDIGLIIEDADNLTIDENIIGNNTDNGIMVLSTGPVNNELYVWSNDIGGNMDGIYFDFVRNSDIYDNYIHNNFDDGIELIDVDPTTVRDNFLWRNMEEGIHGDNLTDVTFDNNTIFNNSETGMIILDSRNVLIYDSNVSYNGASSSGEGIEVETSDNVTIELCQVHNNDDFGIIGSQVTNLSINDNNVSGHTSRTGIYVFQSDYAVLDPNYVWNNNDGVEFDQSDWVTFDSNVIFDNARYGVIFGSSQGPTITGNEIYGTVDATRSALYMSNSPDAVVTGNIVHHNLGDGIEVGTSCHNGQFDSNEVYTNDGWGFMIVGTDNAIVTNNEVYDNQGATRSGFYITGSEDAYFEGNFVYDNVNMGVHIDGACDNIHLNDETIYGNGGYGISIGSTPSATVENSELYDNLNYALYSSSSDFLTIQDNEMYRNDGGIDLLSSDNAIISNTNIYDSTWICYALVGSDNFTMLDLDAQNCTLMGYYFDGPSTGFMTNVDAHNMAAGVYSFWLDNAEINGTNVNIYGNTDSYLYVNNGQTFNITDLWIGFDTLFGILWPSVTVFDGAQDTDLHSGNFLLGEDFVSMDSTDADTDEMNIAGAELTTRVGGCTGLSYYHAAGFPADAAAVVATGATFTPATTNCIGIQATYSADFNFSGYTASGTYSPSGGGGGDSSEPRMIVESEIICPGDSIQFTVTHSSSPLSGVDVDLVQFSPYAGTIASGTTDSEGHVTFTLPVSGNYRAYFTRAGYDYTNPYVLSHTLCEEAPVCTLDSDCLTTERCAGGSCVALTGDCGYASGHIWIDYQCCADSDCAAGTTCVDHVCMSPEEEVHEEAPEEGTTPPEEVAEEENLETGEPEEPVPPEETTIGTGAAVTAQENASATEAKEESEDSSPLLPLLLFLLLVILGGVAYWLLTRKKKSGGYKSRGN